MNSLAKAIRERRESKGWSILHLSYVSGVSTAHLARIEREERFPSGRTLRKLAEPLGFTETELLKLAGFMSRDDSDDRKDRFKKEIKEEIAQTLVSLHKKIDSF